MTASDETRIHTLSPELIEVFIDAKLKRERVRIANILRNAEIVSRLPPFEGPDFYATMESIAQKIEDGSER